jgi:hypothetical protein
MPFHIHGVIGKQKPMHALYLGACGRCLSRYCRIYFASQYREVP